MQQVTAATKRNAVPNTHITAETNTRMYVEHAADTSTTDDTIMDLMDTVEDMEDDMEEDMEEDMEDTIIIIQRKNAQRSVAKFTLVNTAGRLGLESTAIKYPRSVITININGTTKIVSIFTPATDTIFGKLKHPLEKALKFVFHADDNPLALDSSHLWQMFVH